MAFAAANMSPSFYIASSSSSSSSADIITKSKGKGKGLMQAPLPSASYSSVSSAGQFSSSDSDDDAYFSDVSTDSVTSSSSSALGDFVFDDEDEYADYLSVVQASIDRRSAAAFSSQSSSPSSSLLSSSTKKQNKIKSPYRKSTSSFFLPTTSLPYISSSMAAQNPALRQAAHNVTSKMNKLNSFFPREKQVKEPAAIEYIEDVNSAESEAESIDLDARFERAMMFAQFSKRGRAGAWEAPEGVNNGLLKLVSMAQ